MSAVVSELDELRARVTELERDCVRWANANRILSVERDWYKKAAEDNLKLVAEMQAARNEWPKEPMDG